MLNKKMIFELKKSCTQTMKNDLIPFFEQLF
jgi:hypothetical protein